MPRILLIVSFLLPMLLFAQEDISSTLSEKKSGPAEKNWRFRVLASPVQARPLFFFFEAKKSQRLLIKKSFFN